MMQNHSPWQYTSCDLLIFDLDIDLEGQIVNFMAKWQKCKWAWDPWSPSLLIYVNITFLDVQVVDEKFDESYDDKMT